MRVAAAVSSLLPSVALAALLLAPPLTAQARTPQDPAPREKAPQDKAPRALLEAAAAYCAKVAASARFVSGRTLDSVLAQELAPTRPLERLIRPLLRFQVDEANRTVTASLGTVTATAVATQNLGCVLVPAGGDAAVLRARAAPGLADVRPDPAAVDWPRGDRLPSEPAKGVDHAALQAALARAFVDPPGKPPIHTRAVVVVHRGRLVAERYADDVRPDMPLPGWSMSKTLLHALLGVRVQQGKLDPNAPLPVPAWRAATDGHETIAFGDLLAMRSGLAWREDYDDPDSDALRMLFRTGDSAAVYAAMPVAEPPGTRFVYCSGASNLLALVLRRSFADDRDYWAFPRQLFTRLGMRTAVLEADASGTFVASSFGFASARDWARLGQLYCDDGMVDGERVWPQDWLTAARTPHPRGDGRFGLHLWLDRDPDGAGPQSREWPDLPDDVMHMDGHEGQFVVVFPTQQLVVVRLGCTKNGGAGLHALLRSVLAAVGS